MIRDVGRTTRILRRSMVMVDHVVVTALERKPKQFALNLKTKEYELLFSTSYITL